MSKLQGTWRPIEVNFNGRPSGLSAYGPSTFEQDKWTVQTTNGDHVYQLSAVNENADPAAATFVDKAGKISFVGLLSLEGDTLTIARGTEWTKDEAGEVHIARPDSLAPGRNKLVYVWKRSADPANLGTRPSLSIRLFDEGQPEKTLVDQTVRAFFGGKLEAVAGGEAPAKMRARPQAFGRQLDEPITVGTRITGSIEEAAEGQKRVSLEIRLANAVATDEPETEIVRAESVVLQTMLKPKEKKRIHCGGSRWCELFLDLE
ncbi:MAG: hypothetical protein ACTHK7_06595 [Aureliella sp.]